MPNSEPSNLFRGKYRISSTRLQDWDYSSAGLYFVTICVKDRQPCLAEIANGETRLSSLGEIVAEEWQKAAEIRANVILDAWVVMPNHVHGIIGITADGVGMFPRVVETPRRGVSTTTANPSRLKPNSLGSIMGQFKSVCTKRIWAMGCRDFAWQERFHDPIIRDEHELDRIRAYIENNPSRWKSDRNNLGKLWM